MRKQWTKEELIAFENEIGDLYMDNKLPFLFHLSGGNEEQLINIFRDIKEGDYVISNHRSHYHALLHGISPEILKERILNGRSMFIYDREKNFFCSAIIGGTPAIAAGIALALKKKKSKQRVWCFVGDANEDSGHLFEAVRYVDGFELPCTFVIENNNRSVEATNEERWGKMAEYKWDSPSVIKYSYNISYPHARKPGVIDLSKAVIKTDEEYFPLLKPQIFPSFDELDGMDITYKDAIIQSMTELGKNGAIFVGYNVKRGDAMGTLKDVPDEQKIETPVAENLISGLAIGMSFEKFTPVIYFERQDFILVAADAIVNHIDKIERISHGEYKVPVIIRAIVADSGPFYSGPTHSQDFTKGFRKLVNFPIFDPVTGVDVLKAFKTAQLSNGPVMIVERKSRY
ncbi:MAG: Transketolase central region-containing protein [Parcubacteria group bacterium Athens0714_16]|nr:MAG: Transketolase central region-containing protein [Parcubacteria group bacterium Athens0714_16]